MVSFSLLVMATTSAELATTAARFSWATFDPLVPGKDRPPAIGDHRDPLVIGHIGRSDWAGWTEPRTDDTPSVTRVGHIGTDVRQDVREPERVRVDVVLDGDLAHVKRLAATRRRAQPSVRPA